MSNLDAIWIEEVENEGLQHGLHEMVSGTMFATVAKNYALVCIDSNMEKMSRLHELYQAKVFKLIDSCIVASNACTCYTTSFIDEIRNSLTASPKSDPKIQLKMVISIVERMSTARVRKNPNVINLTISLEESEYKMYVLEKNRTYLLPRNQSFFCGPGSEFLQQTDLVTAGVHNYDLSVLEKKLLEAYCAMATKLELKDVINDTLHFGIFTNFGLNIKDVRFK